MIDKIKKIYKTEDLKQQVKDLKEKVKNRQEAIDFWRGESRKWEKKCNELGEENQKLRAWIESRGGVVE